MIGNLNILALMKQKMESMTEIQRGTYLAKGDTNQNIKGVKNI